MTQALKLSGIGAGGLVLFAGAFVTFAAMSGVPMHEIAVIGRLVPAPAEGPASADPLLDAPATDRRARRSDAEELRANSDLLGAFMLPSPYTSSGLRALQSELQTALTEARMQQRGIHERELELDEREQHLKSQYQKLIELRGELERFEDDLRLRKEELDRDQRVRDEREQAGWSEFSRVFAEGDPEEAARRLEQFGPEEAARILQQLPVERAGSLLNALPAARFKEYADAFRTAGRP